MEKKKTKFKQPDLVSGLDIQGIQRKYLGPNSAAPQADAGTDKMENTEKTDAIVPLTTAARNACKTFLLPDAENTTEQDEAPHEARTSSRKVFNVDRVKVKGVEGGDPVAPTELTEIKLPGDNEPMAAQG
jgi:hypothetical protein